MSEEEEEVVGLTLGGLMDEFTNLVKKGVSRDSIIYVVGHTGGISEIKELTSQYFGCGVDGVFLSPGKSIVPSIDQQKAYMEYQVKHLSRIVEHLQMIQPSIENHKRVIQEIRADMKKLGGKSEDE